jgi:hypothetical protein
MVAPRYNGPPTTRRIADPAGGATATSEGAAVSPLNTSDVGSPPPDGGATPSRSAHSSVMLGHPPSAGRRPETWNPARLPRPQTGDESIQLEETVAKKPT